jgi:hypothetical protein
MGNDATPATPVNSTVGVSGVAHGTVVMPDEVARLAAEAEAEDSDDEVT